MSGWLLDVYGTGGGSQVYRTRPGRPEVVRARVAEETNIAVHGAGVAGNDVGEWMQQQLP